jgi:D-xylose 1-dehydrogenase (NADP+, D-xylono-1,5-lactone-forming)
MLLRVRAIRLGLLSTANINREILAASTMTDRIGVVAVASRDGTRARAYAREQGIERAHGSYGDLLEDEGVDAVYISLPNGMHHEWTMSALAAGKHVLCEKPYTKHAAEVEEAWDAADDAGLVLMEGFMYRHHPQTAKLAEIVASGAIGRPVSIHAVFTFPLEDLGNVRAISELDGGALMDTGCYCVSGARLVAGEPVSVLAEQVTGETGVDMAVHGTLRFPEDVVALIETSFRAPRRQHLQVVGEDGVVTVTAPFRVDWSGTLTIARRAPGGVVASEQETIAVPDANSYRLQLDNLADAIEGRAQQLLGRADALGQARAIEALYRSAAEARRVDL